MAALAVLGLLFAAVVAALLVSPSAKIELAKLLLSEGRAQLAGRKAAALARLESRRAEGEIDCVIDGQVREIERRFPVLTTTSGGHKDREVYGG